MRPAIVKARGRVEWGPLPAEICRVQLRPRCQDFLIARLARQMPASQREYQGRRFRGRSRMSGRADGMVTTAYDPKPTPGRQVSVAKFAALVVGAIAIVCVPYSERCGQISIPKVDAVQKNSGTVGGRIVV